MNALIKPIWWRIWILTDQIDSLILNKNNKQLLISI